MGFSDLCRSSKPGIPAQRLASAAYASTPSHAGSDQQLIADCRLVMDQIGTLFANIEHAADAKSGEQERCQTSLCEADDQAFDLVERIAVTRSFTRRGVQSKHAVADIMLALDWYDEPSPCRDRLLLSFVLDAARLPYPAASNCHASNDPDLDATTIGIVRANACLAVTKKLAACFKQKDESSACEQADQDRLDAKIFALKEETETALEALIAVRAFSAPAIHAKRLVLRRMLEAGMDDSDATYLRVELARSYFSDLNAFFPTQEREPSSSYGSIWNTLTSKFRWLTSTIPHR